MHEDDEDYEYIDDLVEDCADYFATVLTEKFPEVDLIALKPNDWRKGWTIIVPTQFTASIKDLEAEARYLRDSLFWQRHVLLPYVIERPKD